MDGVAPSLVGANFTADWSGETIGDLYNRIRTTMPQTSPGSLSPQTNIDIVSFLLQSNGLPAGKDELKNDEDSLKSMVKDTKN